MWIAFSCNAIVVYGISIYIVRYAYGPYATQHQHPSHHQCSYHLHVWLRGSLCALTFIIRSDRIGVPQGTGYRLIWILLWLLVTHFSGLETPMMIFICMILWSLMYGYLYLYVQWQSWSVTWIRSLESAFCQLDEISCVRARQNSLVSVTDLPLFLSFPLADQFAFSISLSSTRIDVSVHHHQQYHRSLLIFSSFFSPAFSPYTITVIYSWSCLVFNGPVIKPCLSLLLWSYWSSQLCSYQYGSLYSYSS